MRVSISEVEFGVPVENSILYGQLPTELGLTPAVAIQTSPRIPGSIALEALEAGSVASVTIEAPPSTVERRFVLATAFLALKSGGKLVAAAPKDRGGLRLRKELEAFGCQVSEQSRRHWRICATERSADISGLGEAIRDGSPRIVEELGLWSQPGLFNWDGIDPGSALLAGFLGGLAGTGADLGCGIGVLGQVLLMAPEVERLVCVDVDRRAVAVARHNLDDPRAEFLWADIRVADLGGPFDFIVSNPPFHDGGQEDRRLGQTFVQRAALFLKRGGRLRLVANRHLPYEAPLREAFKSVSVLADQGGFKVLEAVRA